jgi:very-short-patch-repair endonuclease
MKRRSTPRGGKPIEVLSLSGHIPQSLPLDRHAIELLNSEGDPAVAQIATAQFGAISARQLLAVGLTRRMIHTRTADGRLHRAFQGVYLVGHTAQGPLTLPTAGLLAAGPGSALSFFTAGGLHNIRRAIDGIVDVTVPGAQRRSRKGLRLHNTTLQAHEIHSVNALPITSPARTVADLATGLPSDQIPKLVDATLIARAATRDQLLEAAQTRRRGARLIRQALHSPIDPADARSQAELRLLTLIRKAKLPLPELNSRVAGHLCDLVWHEHRLIAEYDSWLYHHTPERFAADRHRNNDVQSVGYAIFRFTDNDQPEALIARLATELAKRAPGTSNPSLRVIHT